MTQEDLAHAAGLATNVISQVENVRRRAGQCAVAAGPPAPTPGSSSDSAASGEAVAGCEQLAQALDALNQGHAEVLIVAEVDAGPVRGRQDTAAWRGARLVFAYPAVAAAGPDRIIGWNQREYVEQRGEREL